ncbi:MAG: autotransporter outer membrane beta-barrel domain-containing protein, partial [Pseudomonadota bacterium]
IAAQIIADEIGVELDFLTDGGLSAYGYGGSLILGYNRQWTNDSELDLRLRHTQIRLETFGSDDIVASADAISTVAWSRYRFPTGARAFGKPLRFVGELAGSYLPGDQGQILDTDWLAQLGVGVEFDVTETPVPILSQTRFMVRAALGENLRGYSFGISLSF